MAAQVTIAQSHSHSFHRVQSETITFVANVNCSVADGTVISNTATVSSSTPDPDPNNDSSDSDYDGF